MPQIHEKGQFRQKSIYFDILIFQPAKIIPYPAPQLSHSKIESRILTKNISTAIFITDFRKMTISIKAHALENIAGCRYYMDQRILYGKISVVALRRYERRRFFGLYAARSCQTPRGEIPWFFSSFSPNFPEYLSSLIWIKIHVFEWNLISYLSGVNSWNILVLRYIYALLHLSR